MHGSDVARAAAEPLPIPQPPIAAGPAAEHLIEVISAQTASLAELEELRAPLAQLAEGLRLEVAPDAETSLALSRILRQFEERKHSALEYLFAQLSDILAGRDAAALVKSLKLRVEAKHTQAAQFSGKLEARMEALCGGSNQALELASDPATGLPERAAAQLAVRKALSSPKTLFAVGVRVERMEMTQARFGKEICDQIMQISSQTLATRILKGGDSLFSWESRGLLAIVERDESASIVNVEIQRIMATPINQYFELPSRTVYLPIKMSAVVVALDSVRDTELFDKIDKFFAGCQ